MIVAAQSSTRFHDAPAGRRGAALVIALSLLATFSLLGTFYLHSMELELQSKTLDIRAMRARQAAVAGLQAAIGGLYTGIEDGMLDVALGQGYEIPFPVYAGKMGQAGPDAPGTRNIEAHDTQITKATLSIEEESGKVNLNHAPASVLQLLLGIDGETARRLTSSLRQDGAGWLIHPDELVSRGFMDANAYDALDKKYVTTVSVLDHSAPAPYLNINRASSAVLAAVLDLPLERAEQLREAGPYASLDALGRAAEKNLQDLSIAPLLRTDSRCFRIRSTGVSDRADGRGDTVTAAVEAVVIFDDNGVHHIISWRDVLPGDA